MVQQQLREKNTLPRGADDDHRETMSTGGHLLFQGAHGTQRHRMLACQIVPPEPPMPALVHGSEQAPDTQRMLAPLLHMSHLWGWHIHNLCWVSYSSIFTCAVRQVLLGGLLLMEIRCLGRPNLVMEPFKGRIKVWPESEMSRERERKANEAEDTDL